MIFTSVSKFRFLFIVVKFFCCFCALSLCRFLVFFLLVHASFFSRALRKKFSLVWGYFSALATMLQSYEVFLNCASFLWSFFQEFHYFTIPPMTRSFLEKRQAYVFYYYIYYNIYNNKVYFSMIFDELSCHSWYSEIVEELRCFPHFFVTLRAFLFII